MHKRDCNFFIGPHLTYTPSYNNSTRKIVSVITFLTSAFASDSSISFRLVAIVATDDILEASEDELTTTGEEATAIE